MAYDIGQMQAAIWHTEEALEDHRARFASQRDPNLHLKAERSLANLESLLALQTGMLELMLKEIEAFEAYTFQFAVVGTNTPSNPAFTASSKPAS